MAACGGGDGGAQPLDSGAGALPACDPIKQTGCNAGEKCTWIVDVDADPVKMTDQAGHVGCAPIGGIADGAACMDAVALIDGGADSCVAGDLCLSGTCKRICDQQLVPGAGAGACDVTHACLGYRGIFAAGNLTIAGICEPGCDPLTQRLLASKAEACGSADPAMPSGTCVPASSEFKSFACAPEPPDADAHTDRVAPLGDAQGFFGNGCAAGFIPFYFEDASGAMKTLCSGMCAPVKMDMAIAADPATPANVKPWGDTSALGKLSADAMPVAGHATCLVGKKGSVAPDAMGKGIEDCRFLWFPLADRDPTLAIQTPYNDTLGICFAYQKFVDVRVPGGTPSMQPEKTCAELPVTAPATDPFGSAMANGCYPLSQSRRGARGARSALASFRIAHGPGPAVRHIFD
jgi:hypothetical protein